MSSHKVACGNHDIEHGVRVTGASYPQQCLNHPLGLASITGTQSSPRIYRDAGVQTLPPPNGDIFKLVHGREPSQSDYIRNMGTAAIGRFGIGPHLNLYDSICGKVYYAPLTTQEMVYRDAGFQTADYCTTKRALVKAKLKASVTANKFHEASLQAGYRISAESKDEMIAHSEQNITIVRLNAEGNLLEGTVDRLYLPNIIGVPSRRLQSPTLRETHMIHGVHASGSVKHKSQTTLPATRSDSLSFHAKATRSKGPWVEPPAQISALAPSSTEHTKANMPVVYDEYGNAASCSNDFVIFDAGDDATPTIPMTSASPPRKLKPHEQKHDENPLKRSKIFLPVTPRRSFTPIARSPTQSTYTPYRIVSMPRTPPNSEPRHIPIMSQPVQTQCNGVSDAGQERSLAVNGLDCTDTSRPNMIINSKGSVPKKRKDTEGGCPAEKCDESPKSGICSARFTGYTLAQDTPEYCATGNVHNPKKRSRLDRDSVRQNSTPIYDACSIRKMSLSSICEHATTIIQETICNPRTGIRKQRHDTVTHDCSLEISECKDDVVMRCAKDPQISTVQSTSNDAARDHRTTSSRVGNKPSSRNSGKYRQPIAPYVPPAMRAKERQYTERKAAKLVKRKRTVRGLSSTERRE